jgi:hypothetical protein
MMNATKSTRAAGAAALAVLGALFLIAGTGEAAAPVPVLGSSFVQSVGYGHAHPTTLSSGATAATFFVHDLRWKNWGAAQSTGIGIGYYVPRGKPIAAGREVTEKIVAYDLGPCKGRLAYRKMDWWFPGLTKRHPNAVDRTGTAASMCV